MSPEKSRFNNSESKGSFYFKLSATPIRTEAAAFLTPTGGRIVRKDFLTENSAKLYFLRDDERMHDRIALKPATDGTHSAGYSFVFYWLCWML